LGLEIQEDQMIWSKGIEAFTDKRRVGNGSNWWFETYIRGQKMSIKLYSF
jgi:hypothetical protein